MNDARPCSLCCCCCPQITVQVMGALRQKVFTLDANAIKTIFVGVSSIESLFYSSTLQELFDPEVQWAFDQVRCPLSVITRLFPAVLNLRFHLPHSCHRLVRTAGVHASQRVRSSCGCAAVLLHHWCHCVHPVHYSSVVHSPRGFPGPGMYRRVSSPLLHCLQCVLLVFLLCVCP